MNDKEAIAMMQRCVDEIVSLKAMIERLAPKADAYDNIATILRLLPQPMQGYGEDVVWLLKRKIGEIKDKASDASPATPVETEDA